MVFGPSSQFIKCDIQTDKDSKWINFVDGGDGCLYGIPFDARKVLQFHVGNKSVKEIGPDLGDQWGKYMRGIRAGNGNIYCMPWKAEYVLKIIPMEGQDAEVKVLDNLQVPFDFGDGNNKNSRIEAILAKNGCIYYLPYGAKRILKLDPSNDHESLALVGTFTSDFYTAAVLGNDGFIYGISSKQVIKFNPTNNSIFAIPNELSSVHDYIGGVLADDGKIYSANSYGQILKFDAPSNHWSIIGSKIHDGYTRGWERPVLGADRCIYFHPANHDRVLKYNPTIESVSLIGSSHGFEEIKWRGSVLGFDGFIYCIPYNACNILQIDSRDTNTKVLQMIEYLHKAQEDVNDEKEKT